MTKHGHRIVATLATCLAAGLVLAAVGSCRPRGMYARDLYIGPARAAEVKAAAAPSSEAPAPTSGQAAPAAAVSADAPAESAAVVPAAAPSAHLAQDLRVPPDGPIEVDATKAVLLALANNQELVVERLNPDIARTAVDVERAVFDPLASVTLGHETVHGERLRGQGIRESFITGTPVAEGAIEQLFPTGTSVALEGETGIDDVTQDRQLVRTRFGMTVTQALLRGAGREANLARIRQARLDTLATEYELRGFAEMLVATVEQTFWEYLGAKREVEVIRESVKQAEGELANVRERVKAGMVPELEVAAAEAEVALRRQDVVDVRARAEKARLLLVRLMNPAGSDVWSREVRIPEQAVTADDVLDDVEAHVGVALRLRPELNQARIGIKRGDLELVRTRNGLLPRLDLFVTLGKSGYAGSFGGSYGNVPGDSYDFLVGVRAEYPLMNREARADHRRATLDRRQAEEAVKNLAQLVQVDVRTAYVEVMRARELAEAAGITRKYDEAKLKVEQEKYGIGRASSFQVARAQRDLLKSGISELRAMIEQRKALVELYRLEGSLLERRGIAAPGKEPVDVSAKSEAGTRQ